MNHFAIDDPAIAMAFAAYERACDRMKLFAVPAVVLVPLALAVKLGAGDAFEQSWVEAIAVRLLVVAPLGVLAAVLLHVRLARVRQILESNPPETASFEVSADRFNNRRPALLLRHEGAEVLVLSAFVWRTPALTEQETPVRWAGDCRRKVVLVADDGSLFVARRPVLAPWRNHLRRQLNSA